ncbi:MAG: hypothetical protein JSS65_11200 [Armatimonadetes bacterium]|nr:hypothetical protein [Armatimonadota bacterium]
MRSGSTRCPAKINTFLSVGPPDATGYHPLRTVFQAVSIYDELEVTPADKDVVEAVGMVLPTSNTVTKALALVRELVPVPPVHIRLVKNIPAESGLGGGSSDAAGLLRLLSRLVPGGLAPHFCHEVAVAVGADAPFFLVGGRAIGTGYGESLEPLPDLPPRELVVVKPPSGSSTVVAYKALDSKPRPWAELNAESYYNDFERVAGCDSLDAIERLLSLGAQVAQLTGSGSAVFGVFKDSIAANEAAAEIENQGTVFRCRTITREESLWTS